MSAIKGSAIEALVEDVNRLAETGRISRDELEARLDATALRLLETKISTAGWYPIESYERMTRLLLEVEGGGDTDYLVRRGWAAAERLRSTGIYSQLSADRERWGDRLGVMMASIGPAMFRDTTWKYTAGEGEQVFCIRVDVGPGFPESGRHAAQGFIDFLAQLAHQGHVEMKSRRVSEAELEFIALKL